MTSTGRKVLSQTVGRGAPAGAFSIETYACIHIEACLRTEWQSLLASDSEPPCGLVPLGDTYRHDHFCVLPENTLPLVEQNSSEAGRGQPRDLSGLWRGRA
jgi:hypothetical protein